MLALVNEEIGSGCVDMLASYGFEPVIMPRSTMLSYPLSTHPDMNIFIGFGCLFCHESYYKENNILLDKICKLSALELCITDERMTPEYPRDVLFNCLLLGDLLFCNEKHISSKILDRASLSGIRAVHVPQGYTKCSVCPISDRAIITADKPIHDAARSHGLDSLLISSGHIDLDGYDYGFIGGASGMSGNYVFFCGDLEAHPDGDRIADFIRKHKKEPVSLTDAKLRDVGSILFI